MEQGEQHWESVFMLHRKDAWGEFLDKLQLSLGVIYSGRPKISFSCYISEWQRSASNIPCLEPVGWWLRLRPLLGHCGPWWWQDCHKLMIQESQRHGQSALCFTRQLPALGTAESQCSPLSHLLKDTQCEIAEDLLTQLLDSTASTIKN